MSAPAGLVRVRVPATSANLGPGFDTLGLALTLADEVEVEVTAAGLAIDVTGPGARTTGAGEDHLVVRALRAGFDRFGGQPAGIALRCRNRIPHGRGLGSSAAAIVAGVLAAARLCGVVDRDAVYALAADLEGHPDNVAACVYGGLTIAWGEPGAFAAVRLEPSAELRPVACVPETQLPTKVARGMLPATVPHADAAFNAARAALLIAALTSEPRLLMEATQDRLHQSYRAPGMPETAALVERLRAAGIPAVVSGAGPSVLALPWGDAGCDQALDSIAHVAGNPWHVYPLDVDRQGADVQPSSSVRETRSSGE